MTATILYFTPKSELSSIDNLDAFISLCRKSEVLEASSQFEKDVWEDGYRKGKSGVVRMSFSTLESASEGTSEELIFMPEPFLSFAKATLVYLQNKKKVISNSPRMQALRCLEAALRSHGKDARPLSVTADILDSAVELSRRQFSPGVAYRVAGQLEAIAELMRDKAFIKLRTKWAHGLKKPKELGSRISKDALEARQEKLPSPAAIRALGGVFSCAVGAGDTIVSSLAALMMCAPERVNELMRLRRNCLVEGDGRFEGNLGIRWPGSKLADNTTKWLPTQMAPIAREAINRVIDATESASKLARWYTENPRTLYLHPEAEHLRGSEFLTKSDLSLIFWGAAGKDNSAAQWARDKKLLAVKVDKRKSGFRFSDVESAVISMLPPTFPYVPGDPTLLCHESLAVCLRNEIVVNLTPWLCLFECLDQQTIASRLGARQETGIKSIFTRYDFFEDDGSPIVVNTHAFRHYLNMLAQVGGLSDAEIAIFSGRRDVRQNRAYDHMSSDEVQAPIKTAIAGGFMQLVAGAGRDLVSRSNFRGLGLAAAHTTEYGYCTHNFAAEPCQLHRDCINCTEQECIKGERHKEDNLRRLKEETGILLERAREALSDEEYGADQWVKHQTITLERVNQLLSVFEDPSVPVGARVRLNLASVPLVRDEVTGLVKLPASQQRALR